MPAADWDFSSPHVVTLEVVASDIDAYDHVNNSVYLRGSTGRLVALRSLWYLARGMRPDPHGAWRRIGPRSITCAPRSWATACRVGTWIVSTDRKLRVERRFQVRRAPGGETLARARTDYVCINLDSGRAARMPESFSNVYVTAWNDPIGTG